MWLAKAEYTDGTIAEYLFESDPYKNESDDQYKIEAWLIERKDGCIWYSVDKI